jgi:ribonucleoside-diphosphate reductase alpha chain
MIDKNLYEELSIERKKLQKEKLAPKFWSTSSYQLFKEKYQRDDVANPREHFQSIADTLSAYMPDSEYWAGRFFEVMWKGWLSPSTPVLSNTGTTRGLTVSCQGSYITDSIDGIYSTKHETAMLTKNGFGTSAYLGDIRPRGSSIRGGGTSTGVLPIIKGFQADMEYVSQGSIRRGSWAGYIPIDHGDFEEVRHELESNPDGNNIGWNISNAFIERLTNREPEALKRYAKALKTKMITGKGYFLFPDKINAKRPESYVQNGLSFKASNLCTEIMLHSDDLHSYTCVLASLNLALYDEWKDTDLVKVAIVFLDCVCSDFLEKSKGIPGLEKARRATEKGRALGLGAMGFHSYLQSKLISFGSYECHALNIQMFKMIREQADETTKYLSELLGEPEWCKGFGRRNTHCLSIAPTKSTGALMGGVSEGINPDPAYVFTQKTAGGEVDRVNPYLLKIMKERGVYTKANIKDIRLAMGSVQHVEWLSDEEKLALRTAFEINQHDIIRLAAARGKYLDQWQSLNLFFAGNDDESYINDVHREAFLNPDILGLYYVYSNSSVKVSGDRAECEACQ